jgi:Skp family chaperone for outer membrane proteins
MKKGYFVLLLLLFGGSELNAVHYVKIGYVDLEKVVSEYPGAKEQVESLKEAVAEKEEELKKLELKIKEMEEALLSQRELLDEKAFQKRQREIEAEKLEYARLFETYHRDLSQRDRKLTGEILKGIKKVVAEIAKEENFTLIINKLMVIYGIEGIDITDRVIDRLTIRFEASQKKKETPQ